MNRLLRISSLLLVSFSLLFLCEQSPMSPRRFRLVPLPTSARRAPVLRRTSGQAANWAGYVVATNLLTPLKRSVSDVKGSWTVPVVSSSGSLDTSSAIWVGLDGSANNTVEQIGTEQDWTSGAPQYYAWFEMYPARGFMILNFPVAPGDNISAEVQLVRKNKFSLSITNLTQNVGFSIIKRRSAKRMSAEWIVEAPYYKGVLPLADFSTVTFSDCSATVNAVTGPINNPVWQNESLTMEPDTGPVMAQPSGLTLDGTGFSVTWEHL